MSIFINTFKSFGNQRTLAHSKKYDAWRNATKKTTNISKFFSAYNKILIEAKSLKDEHFVSILEQEKKVEEINLINRLYDQTLITINELNGKNERQRYLSFCFKYIKQSDDLFEPESIEFAEKQFLYIDEQIVREGDV